MSSNLEKLVDGVKVSLSSNRERTLDYLKRYELKKYFPDDLSENEKERRTSILEKKVGKSFEKFDSELGGIARKGVTKGSMALAVLNDAYAYVSNVPIANVTGLGYALFALKTVAEIPAMVRYMKKSHDWYGAAVHYLMKPVRYLAPVVGPALESGAFERMVRKQVRKEARDAFIKEVGNYVGFEDRLKKKMKSPLRNVIYRPGKNVA